VGVGVGGGGRGVGGGGVFFLGGGNKAEDGRRRIKTSAAWEVSWGRPPVHVPTLRGKDLRPRNSFSNMLSEGTHREA